MKLAWALVVVGLVLTGCSPGSEDSPAEDVVLRVVTGAEVARDWTLAELQDQVPFAEIDVEGDTQVGPLLIDVIAASGVGEWNTAEVLGMSEGRVIEVALDIEAAAVDITWIFDVTNRGTLKLAAADLPRDRWVRDVGEIRFP